MIGQKFSHYRILEKIGSGGMGVVYRARDETLEREVALKVLAANTLADEASRQRFRQEALALSRLNHPHICTIYEVGEADGQTYIAMEYVQGRPLSAMIPRDGLPVETSIRHATQIADALAHAHDRGVIHRDLKSSNVVITPEGRAKVLDFGLAKRLRDDEVSEATRSRVSLTEGGALVGTLHYMAPEVLRGEPADARSDVWALGAVLYEMARGERPFQGQTGFELSSAILREPPRPLPPRVATALRAIIEHCLAKEPAQRYQRASELRAALEVVLLASAAPPPGAPSQAATPERRLSTGGRPSPNPEANEYFEKAMLLWTAQHYLPRMRQMLERALELDAHFAEARAWYGFTHLLMVGAGYSNNSAWLYQAEDEIRRALQDDANSVQAHSSLAAVYFYQGRKDLIPGEVKKALKTNPEDLDARFWLMLYHQFNGDYAAAQNLVEQLVQRNPVFFVARLHLGYMMMQQGDTAGAIRQLGKILEQDPQNIYVIYYLVWTYMNAADLGMARQTLERARAEDRKNYGTRLLWALQLALEGNQQEALKEMDGEVLKYADTLLFVTLAVAEFYALLGETEKALEWLYKAVRNGDEREEWFRRDPLLASIRNEPRFQQILASIAFRRKQRAKQ